MSRLTLLLTVALALGCGSTAATAIAATELPTLPSNDADAPPLTAATYHAGLFPLAFRVIVPGGTWLGGQGRTVSVKRGSFGWAEFLRPPNARPLGAISMIAPYGLTTSVAATIARLRANTAGVTYEPTKSARVAGFSGSSFDGAVVGKHHLFVPFTPVTHAATFHPDAYRFDQGEVFRIIVVDVRGTIVVFLLENVGLPTDQFPDFLASATGLLGSLRFAAAATVLK
jgi:hypothetical protein